MPPALQSVPVPALVPRAPQGVDRQATVLPPRVQRHQVCAADEELQVSAGIMA